jgi:lactate dehydrogenase-like 2-hydroxyacid dehydrogenase
MTNKPTLLIDTPALAGLIPRLSQDYEVLSLWDKPDFDAFAAGPGQAVRVILGGFGKIDRAMVEKLPNLGLIARIGTGYESIDLPHARAHGVQVTNTPGVNADDVADVALALLLDVVRGIVDGDRLVRSGGWTNAYRGGVRASMKGLKVGVVGLGAIGEAVAERTQAFKSEVRWWGPRPKPGAAWPMADSLMALAVWCDALMICARADASNTRLIDGAVLDAVGPAGLVVNITRGGIIDEAAMIDRLKDGRLGGAGLDVFEQEPTPAERWVNVPNTVLTPHVGGATRGALRGMVDLALENVHAFLAGDPLPTPVPQQGLQTPGGLGEG